MSGIAKGNGQGYVHTLVQIKEFLQCLKHKIRAWNVEKIRKDEYLDKDYKPKFSEPYMQPQPGVNFRVP